VPGSNEPACASAATNSLWLQASARPVGRFESILPELAVATKVVAAQN